MILKKYEDLPENMQNENVKEYYESLRKKRIDLWFKRIFDIVFSVILLILLSPIFLLLAVWIKLDSKGEVFFRQERVTQYGKIFQIYKFRSMISNAEGSLVTAKTDTRITKVGKVIRKMKLDELPQLMNVLFGDMSFVGTRPEVKKYVDMYTDEMLATLLMPAGITSVASIEYKDEENKIAQLQEEGKSIDEAYRDEVLPGKMKYNLEYIKQFSIWQDLKICAKTILEIF